MPKLIDMESGLVTTFAIIMECLGSTYCGKATTAFYMNVGHGQPMGLELIASSPNLKRPLLVPCQAISSRQQLNSSLSWWMILKIGTIQGQATH